MKCGYCKLGRINCVVFPLASYRMVRFLNKNCTDIFMLVFAICFIVASSGWQIDPSLMTAAILKARGRCNKFASFTILSVCPCLYEGVHASLSHSNIFAKKGATCIKSLCIGELANSLNKMMLPPYNHSLNQNPSKSMARLPVMLIYFESSHFIVHHNQMCLKV